MDDMPSSTAWGVICFLNWPAMILSNILAALTRSRGIFPYDWGRLAVGLLFWTYAGWLLDRRLVGVATPVVRSRTLRTALHATGFAAALLAFCGGILETDRSRVVWAHIIDLVKSARVYLLGREINTLGAVFWGLLGIAYFGNKMLRLTFKRPSTATSPAHTSYTADPQSPSR
jgi:hypothetical protein